MHPCVHVQVFTLLCVFEDSLRTGILPVYVYSYVSVPVCLCMSLWYICSFMFACIRDYTHKCLCKCVSVKVCCSLPFYVCVHRPIDMHACVPVCLWVSSGVFVGLCVYVYSHVECVHMYKSVYMYLHTSAQGSVSVSL